MSLNPTLTSDLTNLNDAANVAIFAHQFLSEDVSWPALFDVKQSTALEVQYTGVKPPQLYRSRTEGQAFTYDKMDDGPVVTHRVVEKEYAVEISAKQWRYLRAEAFSRFVGQLGASSARVIDADCMSIFPDGFASGLFSNSQTFGDNLATTTFGYAPLRTLFADGARRTNDDGNLASVNFDTLILPPDKVLEARRILNSELGQSVAGTSGNIEQMNELQGMFRVLSTPEFTSTTQWYAVDSSKWDAEIAFGDMPAPRLRIADERGRNAVVEDIMRYHFGHNNAAHAAYGFQAT